MNILYVSHLSENIAAGLNWSVPAGVKAQSKYDNVLWVDVNQCIMPHWLDTKVFHHASEFKGLKLKNFPSPFNKPDLVVFEGFYEIREVLFARTLPKQIPYIIIPRGSLTDTALHNHSFLKKKIAHFVCFDSFIRKAAAIQFLTENEYRESKKYLDVQHYILSNGFTYPEKHKTSFSKRGIKSIFIGRLDMYHKGLDVLMDSICMMKEELREKGFTLFLYGPQKYDYDLLKSIVDENQISDLVELKGEITGIDKENAILDADLFLMPSRFEGHPMGLVEALAYGLPVFVTPGSNMAKEVESVDCGWVCNQLTSEVVCSTLRRIMSETDMLPNKGANAREFAQQYDWVLLAQKFHSIASKIISERNA